MRGGGKEPYVVSTYVTLSDNKHKIDDLQIDPGFITPAKVGSLFRPRASLAHALSSSAELAVLAF